MHLKLFGLFLRFLQWIISIFYSQTKPHIIIGSSAGTNVNGSSKALFLFMIHANTPIKGFFITRNKSLYQEYLNTFPSHFLYAYSFKALGAIITARAFIITHGPYDITPFKITNTKKPLVNLWHGCPIKKVGTDSPHLTKKQKMKVLGNFDGLVVMSEEEKVNLSRSYRTKPENTWITGAPRNDLVFHPNENIRMQIPYIIKKKVILYAPTWRDFENTKLFPFDDFDSTELNDFLTANNAIILLRIHKNELNQHHLEENEALRICDGNVVQELNELLPFTDILITDYSSIIIDYLLIDKPIIFIPYDLEEFRKKRGFYFEFNKISPGPKVNTFKKFQKEIKKYLDNPNFDSYDRNRIKNRFHKHQDAQSSKRVYEKIENLIRNGQN